MVTRLSSGSISDAVYQVSTKSDNFSLSYGDLTIFKMAAAAILNFKNCNFWSRDCNRAQYQCSVPHFIKIGRFFTQIWRFINGGGPPCWILKICSFCHAARIDMPFCFLIQNFAEIGQSIDELWPKNRF